MHWQERAGGLNSDLYSVFTLCDEESVDMDADASHGIDVRYGHRYQHFIR